MDGQIEQNNMSPVDIQKKLFEIPRATMIAFGIAIVLLILLKSAFSLDTTTACIAFTGAGPDSRLFNNKHLFYNMAETVRDKALNALVRSFDEDSGFFIYAMHPDGRTSSENLAVRQMLASRSLAIASNNDPGLIPLHRQNLEIIFSDWYREDGKKGFVFSDGRSSLGANALFLRALIASPLFDKHREKASKLKNSLISLRNEDGSFNAWFHPPQYKYDEEFLLTFYSGEALLALLEYAEKTGDEAVLRAAEESQNFYLDLYVEQIDENYHTAYVPWHTQSLKKLHTVTGNNKYVEAIFILNDRLLEIQDRNKFIGRFYDPQQSQFGSPHGASDGVFTESLVSAYQVARSVEDKERITRYKNALITAIYNLEQLQYEPSIWYSLWNNETSKRLDGGITTHACNDWIRIDNTAHVVDGLELLLKDQSMQ